MALITALMFTVLAFVLSMTLLYMVTAGTRTSGALKRYKTATEATYGGSELVAREMIGMALAFPNVSTASNPFSRYLPDRLRALTLLPESNLSCLHIRLTTPRRFWSPACAAISSSTPDISFLLNAASGAPYRIYSNIVDTSEWRITSFAGTGLKLTTSIAGNSDITSGSENTELIQGAVVESGGQPLESPHYPYLYKIEIQGERRNNPAMEKSNLSILYAY